MSQFYGSREREPGYFTKPDMKFEIKRRSAFIIYVFLVIVITFPSIIELNSSILGSPHTDTWNGVWGIYYVKSCLLKGNNPFHTDKIFYPTGGDFYPINLLNGILVFPLSLFVSLPAAYNLMIMSLVVAAALGTYLLVRYLNGDTNAAFFAGAGFAANPIIISALHNGTDELLGLCWIPFYILYLFKLIGKNRRRYLLLSVVFFFISFVCCWYIGFALALFTVLVFLRQLVRGEEGGRKKVILRNIVIVSLATMILVLPFFLLSNRATQGEKILISHKTPKMVRDAVFSLNATDISTHFRPRRPGAGYHPRFDPRAFLPDPDKYYFHSLYLGYIVLFLALVGLFPRGKSYGKWFWLICLVFFLLFSWGPRPRLGETVLSGKILTNLLPFSLLDRVFPLSSFISLPFRFGIMAYLSLFVLAAAGLRRITRRVRREYGLIIILAVSAACVSEYLFLAPVPYPLERSSAVMPEFVSELAGSPGKAVIEVPTEHPAYRALRPGMYYQTGHGKKVFYSLDVGFSSNQLGHGNEFLYYVNLLAELSFDVVESPAVLPGNAAERASFLSGEFEGAMVAGSRKHREIEESIGELRELGFSRVVVYRDLLPESVEAKLSGFLRLYLGEPIREANDIAIYRIF